MYETLEKIMLAATQTLKLRCEACNHTAELSRRDAFARFGMHASAYQIRRRVRCQACGEKDRIAVSV
jgi:DNA-directed RNA polymerase subunit RPC12/RpoP